MLRCDDGYPVTRAASSSVVIHQAGHVALHSNGPWYRLLRALADLFVGGQITLDDLQAITSGYTQAISDDGDPAAWYALNAIVALTDEGHGTDDELRALLQARIGA